MSVDIADSCAIADICNDDHEILELDGIIPLNKDSGVHWYKHANEHWKNSTEIESLSEEFRTNVRKFKEMLLDNGIEIKITSGYRPKQRSYLMHYAARIAKNYYKEIGGDSDSMSKISPEEADKALRPDGVDIQWEHKTKKASIKAAVCMWEKFDTGYNPVALSGNHLEGNAVDLKFNFLNKKVQVKDGRVVVKYSHNGAKKTTYLRLHPYEKYYGGTQDRMEKKGIKFKVIRNGDIDGKKISKIENEDLSKLGKKFGLRRRIDGDILHWSISGR